MCTQALTSHDSRAQLTCPLTGKLFEHPVRINCEQEHAFERAAIELQFKSKKSCPLCHTAATGVFEDKRLNDQLRNYGIQPQPMAEKKTQILTFEDLLKDAHEIIAFVETNNSDKPIEAIKHLNHNLNALAIDLLQKLAIQLSREETIPKFFIGIGQLKKDFDIEPYSLLASVKIHADSHKPLGLQIPPQGPLKEYIYQAKAGNTEAQFQVGMCYHNGDGVEQDYEQAVKWFRKSAKQGHAKAQYYLSFCYLKRKDVAKDTAMAFTWMQRAADQNYVLALYWMGYLYKHGFGALHNKDLEHRYFNQAFVEAQKLAKEGQAEGQYVTAMCHHYGHSTKQNYKIAAEFYLHAAAQGYALAQYKLALLYFSGDGVHRDTDEGIKWLELAAQNGVAEAQYILGECYYCGDSVKKNRETGFIWFQKAAKQGIASAQDRLYTCYKHGEGVSKDIIQAYYWDQKAKDQGFIHEKGGFTGVMDAFAAANSVYFLM